MSDIEIKIDNILKHLKSIIADQAQQIAILQATLDAKEEQEDKVE